jgi:hypothetical protein
MKTALSALYRGWMVNANSLGIMQTLMLLAVIDVLVVGLISPLIRLFSGGPLTPPPMSCRRSKRGCGTG